MLSHFHLPGQHSHPHYGGVQECGCPALDPETDGKCFPDQGWFLGVCPPALSLARLGSGLLLALLALQSR